MPSSEDGKFRLNRRAYLGIAGATSANSMVFGTAIATGEPGEGEYERVVDIVEAGADNSGEEPIDDVFHDEARDDTLIKFPSGTYAINQIVLSELSHFAMVGDDATLVPGDDHSQENWIVGGEVEDFIFESFTIDTSEEGVGPTVIIDTYDSQLTVRDIDKVGYQSDGGPMFSFGAQSEDGSVLLERITALDGGESVAIYSETTGPMTVRDCHLENFEDNGLYCPSDGPITVEGGTYWNNNIAQIRLGSEGSSIDGATIGTDKKLDTGGEPVNMRGVRIADGSGPVTIKNCDIRMERGQGFGGIVGAYDGGSFEVYDTRIYVGREYTTIGSGGYYTSFGIVADNATAVEAGERTIENVSITGGGHHYAAMGFRRDNNSIRNVCINQTGTDERHGIIFDSSGNNEVYESTIDVPGETIVVRNGSGVRTANISEEGSCPAPGGDDQTSSSEDGSDQNTDQTNDESEQSTEETEQTDESTDQNTDQNDETTDETNGETDQPTDETEQTPDQHQGQPPEDSTDSSSDGTDGDETGDTADSSNGSSDSSTDSSDSSSTSSGDGHHHDSASSSEDALSDSTDTSTTTSSDSSTDSSDSSNGSPDSSTGSSGDGHHDDSSTTSSGDGHHHDSGSTSQDTSTSQETSKSQDGTTSQGSSSSSGSSEDSGCPND